MKKLKIVFILSFTLLLAFCKKSNELTTNEVKAKAHTFEELKEIAKTDTNLSNAMDATHQLYLMKLSSITVQPTRQITAVKYNIDFEDAFKNVKSPEDAANALRGAGIANGDKVLKQILIQLKNINELMAKYPEIKSLSQDQQKELLSTQMEIKDKNNKSLNFQSLTTVGLKVMKMGCYDDFNFAAAGCENGYNYEMLAIWSAVQWSAVETGGWSAGGGLILSLIAYAQWNSCLDLAEAAFANCG